MMTINSQKEYADLIFGKCEELLLASGIDCSMTGGEEAATELCVAVRGPSENMALFYLEVAEDIEGLPISISAIYASDLLEAPVMDSWTFTRTESTEYICSIIRDFVEDCAYEEFSAIVEPEIINDDNLQDFIAFLSDEALTEEGEYAVGFMIKDEGGMETAAAASFFCTEDSLVVDNIVIADNYRIEGFEEYISRYIYETINM